MTACMFICTAMGEKNFHVHDKGEDKKHKLKNNLRVEHDKENFFDAVNVDVLLEKLKADKVSDESKA